MQVVLNGTERSVVGTTLAALCAENGYSVQNIIVELNAAILPGDSDFETVRIQDGDHINLFRIVAGG